MTDMPRLAAWLRAQYDEDASLATAANAVDPAPWTAEAEDKGTPNQRSDWDQESGRPGTGMIVAADGVDLWDCEGAGSLCMTAASSRHAARHDPARVLRAIAAKRRVIADYEDAERTLSVAEPGTPPHDIMTGATNTLRRMLRLLAAEYADRPGYREEWRP